MSRHLSNRSHRRAVYAAQALALTGCVYSAPQSADAGGAAAEPTISTDRPSFSDGTGLVPHGHLQIETGYTFTEREAAGTDTERHALADVLARYRLLDGLEARLLFGGYVFQEARSAGGTDRTDGASDLGLGIKVPVSDQNGWLPTLALGTNLFAGTGADAFSTGDHATFAQKLLWSYALDDGFGLGGNVVLSFPNDGGERFSQTAFSVYGTWAPRDGTTLFGEYYVLAPYANDTGASHNADFGVLHLLSPSLQVDARVGFGLNDIADDFFTGVGISFLF